MSWYGCFAVFRCDRLANFNSSLRQVHDPWLDDHLQHWGIDRTLLQKVEKTLEEKEEELNETFNPFSS